VAAQVLGQRVHHDVGAVLERPAQVGVGTVLSTISGTPWRCAISAMRAMSVTLPCGLPRRFDEDGLGARVDQRLEAPGLR
jgi:hypothetical protein